MGGLAVIHPLKVRPESIPKRKTTFREYAVPPTSPANPQGLRSDSQHLQWRAGGGYTIKQGFRVGVSSFSGPFLDRVEDRRECAESIPFPIPAHQTGSADFPHTAFRQAS